MLSLLIAMLSTQCATGITDGTQTFCGAKIMNDGLQTWGNIYLRGSSYFQTVDGSPIIFRDSIPSSNLLTPSYVFETGYTRWPWSEVVRVYNGGNPIFIIYGNGNVATGTIMGVGHSGDPILQAVHNYVSVAADFPENYQGEHGALSVSPGGAPCGNEAFNMIQATNGLSRTGARTDYTFNVTCRGGIYSRNPPKSYELPICNNALPEPPEPNNRYGNCTGLTDAGFQGNFGMAGPLLDGGYCYDWTTYYGPDGGYAKHGTVFNWVDDVEEGCVCNSKKYDGGPSPAGWFKLSDRTECRP